LAALTLLRDSLADTTFGLSLPGAEAARQAAELLRVQLDDSLLPRFRRSGSPLLVVVGGPTGAGKSTLVNSLVGSVVSPSGVVRPTTAEPVLVRHPDDADWFEERFAEETTPLRRVDSEALAPGLALLDATDLDSVVTSHREIAQRMLAAADLWLFVTTAARYADAAPWQALRAAQARRTSIAVVLDRVPPEAAEEVERDLARMLGDQGLGDAPLFTIPEVDCAGGLLPAAASGALRNWLNAVAADDSQRERAPRQAFDGVLANLRPRVASLTRQASAQAAATEALTEAVRNRFDAALNRLRERCLDGTILHGGLLWQWQRFAGSPELPRLLAARVGRWRDQLLVAITGRAVPGRDLLPTLGAALARLITELSEAAAEQVLDDWRANPAGVGLLAEKPLSAAVGKTGVSAAKLVEFWEAEVIDFISATGPGATSRALSTAYGRQSIALLATLAAVIPPSVLTGSSAAVPTDLLGALTAALGDPAALGTAETARDQLLVGVDLLFAGVRSGFEQRIALHGTSPEVVSRLRAAMTFLDQFDVSRPEVAQPDIQETSEPPVRAG
jgi:energy-coupling factor transporter ATP-binding protein EcfA2